MIIALLVIAVGFYCIVKTDKVHRFTGPIPFAEKYVGTGGTYTFLKLLGLGMIIFSFMWMTGGLDAFIGGTIGKVIPGA